MTRTLGGMEIFGEISAGGMGSVLLAKKTGVHGFEKIVAVKTIRAELADREDIRKLFLDEARLAARIEHPAVTQVHEFGEDDGTLFLAMEYIHGVSLEALLEKLGAIPAGIAARIGAAICRGLHAAHETTGPDGKLLGVVHRDVSPPNVMITFDGGVKILDFGIALMKNRRAPDTQLGRVRGKLAYMAPEQVAGGRVDRRTDVYGVANVLFELVTGEKLRGELLAHEVATAFDRPLPAVFEARVPRCLKAIIAQGLARAPEERFVDARAMAIALDAASVELAGESLEEFALRVLAAEHAAHKKQLAELTGASIVVKKSRGPTLVASGATPPPVIVEKPRQRRIVPWMIAIGAVVLIVTWFVPSKIEPPPPAPIVVATPEPEPEPTPPVESAKVVPAPVQKRVATPVRVKKTETAKREIGYLTIGAHPYGIVLVDGREHGLTPLLKIPLETGSHEIKLLDPASRAVRASESIEIRANLLTNRTYR